MKKLVSRFMAVLMAMTMILSMSMTVFAAEAPKGILTVNNTVAGKTLDLYQIFSATKSSDNVAYTLNSAYEGFFQSKISGASTLTGEAYIQRILDSRRIELWGEGFRFFDLKRLNVSLDRTGSNFNATVSVVLTIPSDDKRWTYLIPQSEINANPLCEQNEL